MEQENTVDYNDLKGSFVSNNSSFDGLYDHYVNKNGMKEGDFANKIIPSLWINGPKTHKWLVDNGYLTEEQYQKAKADVARKEEEPIVEPKVLEGEATDVAGNAVYSPDDDSVVSAEVGGSAYDPDSEGEVSIAPETKPSEKPKIAFPQKMGNLGSKIKDGWKKFNEKIDVPRDTDKLNETLARNASLASLLGKNSGASISDKSSAIGDWARNINLAKASYEGLNGLPLSKYQSNVTDLLNNIQTNNVKNFNKINDSKNTAKEEAADKRSRIDQTRYLSKAPEPLKEMVGQFLGSKLLSREAFEDKLGAKGRQELLEAAKAEDPTRDNESYVNSLMDYYYNDYVSAHDQYEPGLTKQGAVIANTGADLGNVYKALENRAKTISNDVDLQNYVNGIRGQINELRKLKYDNIKSSKLDYFAVEQALMNVVSGIYTTSNGQNVGGNAGVNVPGVGSAGISAGANRNQSLDKLAAQNVPLAKEAADQFKNLTNGNVTEWNKWIDTQIKALEKTVEDIKKINPNVAKANTLQSRFGFDGTSPINQDYSYYSSLWG